ncbi:hypothetical protein [Gluconobacter albidus]|uniref:hypothetical protein n=1 Tax=Gluconobacter albidus TaxID=318683 RepID=UPI000ABD01A8|nr:hypothetical protein [Gluconobacter albidus]
MWLIVIAAIGAWFYWGNPTLNVANQFWKNDAAPWEKVTAIYFPDNLKTYDHMVTEDLNNVAECRNVVKIQANLRNDPDFHRGSYICNVGKEREEGGISIYRLSVR